MKEVKGAVIYTRVSTGEQDKNGTSPETQLDACRAKALALGLPIIAEYYDGGVSGGFLMSRTGMQSALADIKAGRADTLICATMDRYSRDVEHQHRIKREVKEAGGRIIFCDMEFEDTPEGDLNFTIHGGFKAYEKMVIRKRTVAGREKLAHLGIQTARLHSPIGYHIVGTADVIRGDYPADLLGKYIIIEAEAAIVREIFARYAAGNSQNAIAIWLNEQGIPTRFKKPFWGHTSVAYILRNPIYKGVAAFGKNDYRQDESRQQQRHPHTGRLLKTKRVCTPADPETWITWPVPALVSEDQWNAAQARASINKGGCPPKQIRLLAGRIFCPECESGVICASYGSVRGKGSTHYVCGQYARQTRYKRESRCLSKHYPIAFVESAVITALTDAMQRPDFMEDVWNSAQQAFAEDLPLEEKNSGIDTELARVETALNDLNRKQTSTVKAQIAGMEAGAEASAYNAIFAEIAEKRKVLTTRRDELAQKQNTTPQVQSQSKAPKILMDLPDLLAEVQRILTSPSLPGEDKRDALGLLVERVYPIADGAKIVFLPEVLQSINHLSALDNPVPASFPRESGLASSRRPAKYRGGRRTPCIQAAPQ